MVLPHLLLGPFHVGIHFSTLLDHAGQDISHDRLFLVMGGLVHLIDQFGDFGILRLHILHHLLALLHHDSPLFTPRSVHFPAAPAAAIHPLSVSLFAGPGLTGGSMVAHPRFTAHIVASLEEDLQMLEQLF